MPDKIKLLIVEDNPLDQEIYLDSIGILNKEISPNFEIEPIVRSDKQAGLDAINTMKDDLNGAFIDLKLATGQAVGVSEGNDLIGEIYQKLRFPIIVLTNTPGDFNGDFKTSLFLQVINKTDADYGQIIMSLINIYQTGITKILGRKGLVEKMLDEIFWKNISNTLGEWLQIEDSEKPLLRYTLTHLQEHLEISDDGSEFDIVYPIENYIVPSIKDYFFTGDIIIENNNNHKRYVILNPACDLAPHGEQKKPKAAQVVIAEIQSFEDTPLGTSIKKAKKEPSNNDEAMAVEKARDSIFKLITNNGSPQYYYLPDTTIIKGGLINFQRIASIKYTELVNYRKEATITSSFVKDIIAKFSFYYSRQGSPDFDFARILAYHTTK